MPKPNASGCPTCGKTRPIGETLSDCGCEDKLNRAHEPGFRDTDIRPEMTEDARALLTGFMASVRQGKK